MKFNKNTRIEKKNGIVILANIYNGMWYRMTQECFDILECFLTSEKDIKHFLDNVFDIDDKDYLCKTFNYLEKIEIIEKEEKNYFPQNIGFAITHRCNLFCTHCSYGAGTVLDNESCSKIRGEGVFGRTIDAVKLLINYVA